MDSIFDRVEDKLPIVKERLAHLSFINDYNLKYNKHEGYHGNGIFGYGAGPCLNFENLAHEMAHAMDCLIQNKPGRLRKHSWGLQIRSFQEIMGERYYEPLTMQPTELECRVVGYQKHLMEMAADPAAETITETMADCLYQFMPDYYKGGKTDKQRIQTRIDLIEKSYNSINKFEIPHIWSRISKILYGV